MFRYKKKTHNTFVCPCLSFCCCWKNDKHTSTRTNNKEKCVVEVVTSKMASTSANMFSYPVHKHGCIPDNNKCDAF